MAIDNTPPRLRLIMTIAFFVRAREIVAHHVARRERGRIAEEVLVELEPETEERIACVGPGPLAREVREPPDRGGGAQRAPADPVEPPDWLVFGAEDARPQREGGGEEEAGHVDLADHRAGEPPHERAHPRVPLEEGDEEDDVEDRQDRLRPDLPLEEDEDRVRAREHDGPEPRAPFSIVADEAEWDDEEESVGEDREERDRAGEPFGRARTADEPEDDERPHAHPRVADPSRRRHPEARPCAAVARGVDVAHGPVFIVEVDDDLGEHDAEQEADRERDDREDHERARAVLLHCRLMIP